MGRRTQRFDFASENAMTAMGYDTGKFSPCLYHSSAGDTSVFRHGNDLVVAGTRTQQEEFEEQLSKHLIVKHFKTLGPRTALRDVTEVRILNRILRWVEPPYGSGRERTEHEADPRHVELIMHRLGLSCSWKWKWNLMEVSQSHNRELPTTSKKKNLPTSSQYGPLSARVERQSHPLAGQAQACGRPHRWMDT